MEGGFSSGVIVVPDSTPVDASGLPTMRLTVNSTDPLWFFDQAGGLCHRGALLAVNPSTTQTAAQFKENASKDPGPSSVASAKNSGGASATTGDGDAPLQTGTAFNSGRGTKDESMAVVSFAAVFFGVVIGIL
ncbi:hypothetical protein ONZ45_g17756 [Pleurotus djamor]|nr:hypothetical protein ONZ45_g17756 [Pleurotus djamor]